MDNVKNHRDASLLARQEQEEVMTRPHKDPSKMKNKNIKVTEDCHKRLKEYLYHQRPNWFEINEVGDVVEMVLREWEEYLGPTKQQQHQPQNSLLQPPHKSAEEQEHYNK